MQVNLNNNAGPVQRPVAKAVEHRPKSGVEASGTSFHATEALNVALNQTPEVRPEIVEKAKRLIADSHYPPTEAIRKISDLLAMNLQEIPEVPGTTP